MKRNKNLPREIKWYQSRVLWVNIFALIFSLVQWKYGLILPGELQGIILTILNIILRFDTSEAITIGNETKGTDAN